MANLPKPKIILPRWPIEGPLIRPFPKLNIVKPNNQLSGFYDENGEYVEDESGSSFLDFLNTQAGQSLTSTVVNIGAKSAGLTPVYNPYGYPQYGAATGTMAPYSAANPMGYRTATSTISPLLILGALGLGAFLLLRKK